MIATKSATRVGFIGLGNQGGGIAERIARSGWTLTVWGRRPEATAPFAAMGCRVAATCRDLGASTSVVGVCVRADADVRAVLLGETPGTGLLGGMKPGGIVVIHSTVAPETAIALGEEAAARGIALLDGPVSGGRAGALAGTMAVMVGGDAAPLAAARPVLEAFAANVIHVGPVGAGQSVKLINNGVSFANMVIVIEALKAASALGFDRDAVAQVIRVSSGGSAGLQALLTESALAKLASPINNIQKDVGHLRDLLHANAADAPLLTDVAGQATGAVRQYAQQEAVPA